MNRQDLIKLISGTVQHPKKGVLVFPDDFTKDIHPMYKEMIHGAPDIYKKLYGDEIPYQWTYSDDKGNILISIILGSLFYSNGKETYEMYDMRFDSPEGYLTVEEINIHLLNNPISWISKII